MKKNMKKKGFTLIELIVVIAILGILAAIAIPRLGSFTDGAKVKAIEADHKIIVNAVAQFYSDNDAYPAAATFAADVNPYMNSTIANMQTETGATFTWAAAGTGFTLTTDHATLAAWRTAHAAPGLVYATN